MKSLASFLAGLLSSLLLSLGFSRLAAAFDPLDHLAISVADGPGGDRRSAAYCVAPCKWREA